MFLLIILLITTSLPVIAAESPHATPPPTTVTKTNSTSTFTPQWFEEQQQAILEMQSINQGLTQTLKIEGLSLQTKIASLKQMTLEVMTKMLDLAAQERETTRTKLESLRAEYQAAQNNLAKLVKNSQTQAAALTKFKATAPPTDASALATYQQKLTQLEEENVRSQQAINVQKQYLELSKTQLEMVGKRFQLALEWHVQLQQAQQQSLLAKQQQALTSAKTILERQRQALVKKQQDIALQPTRLETAQVTREMLQEMLKQAELEKETAKLEVENLRLESQTREANIERQHQNLQEQQEKLSLQQKVTSTEGALWVTLNQLRVTELENGIKWQTKLLGVEEQYLNLLKSSRAELVDKQLKLANESYDHLLKIYQRHQEQELEERIQQQHHQYLARSAELRKQLEELQETDSTMLRYLLGAQIWDAEERAQQYELKLAYLKDQLDQLAQLPLTLLQQKSTKISEDTLQQVHDLLAEITALQTALTSKISMLSQQQEMINKPGRNLNDKDVEYKTQAETVLRTLITNLQQLAEPLPTWLQTGQTLSSQLEQAYKDQQRQELLRQRQWPNNRAEWQVLLDEIRQVPILVVEQLQITGSNFIQNLQQMNRQTWFLLILGIIVLIGFGSWLRQQLKLLVTQWKTTTDLSFLMTHLLVIFELLQKNARRIVIAGIFWLLLWVTKPTELGIVLGSTLLLVWLGIQLALDLAWLLLANNRLLTDKHRLKMYRQLQGVFIFVGILTVITVLGHLLEISLTLRDLLDTIFVLCLSLTLLPIFYIRNMILASLEHLLKNAYWLWVYRLMSLLVPLAIFAVVILGLLGYLNLGWNVAKQISLLLVILTAWLVAQGLLTDMITFAKNFALKHSNYGLLWTQDIIPLIHKVLGIALVALAIIAFSWIKGWYGGVLAHDIAIKESIEKLLFYPLFSLGNSQINLAEILLSIFALWIVFWFGSWMRQVTYRWIYSNISDLGARHSLSVFTQYAIVLIGLLISLRIMGIDLTTLTVFAGALGVGLGFGLQNIANNFVSGILLLIERPLRTGDVVSIGGNGNHEGTVTQIGIRSLTIQTWDNQEVIVPNSQLLEQPFTNWTRSNPIVRTKLTVGISYEDDPHLAMRACLEAMNLVPEIAKEPPPAVHLIEFADFAIILRLDYYTDVQKCGYLAKRSSVLLKVWDRFRELGIKIPYPQREVFVKLANDEEEDLELKKQLANFKLTK